MTDHVVSVVLWCQLINTAFILVVHPAAHYLRIRECGRLCFDRCVFIWMCACYSHKSKSIKPNRIKFGGMICYYPGTVWSDFGIDQVKGQDLLFTIAVNFHPIGMQLMPKIAQSADVIFLLRFLLEMTYPNSKRCSSATTQAIWIMLVL